MEQIFVQAALVALCHGGSVDATFVTDLDTVMFAANELGSPVSPI